jgi:hypothetical protein
MEVKRENIHNPKVKMSKEKKNRKTKMPIMLMKIQRNLRKKDKKSRIQILARINTSLKSISMKPRKR